jgi:hypothetical protein
MGICCRNNSAVVQTDKGKATETYAKFFVDPSSSDENTAKSRSDSEKEETSSEENSSEHPSTDAASATTRSTIHSLPMVEENGTDPQRSLTSKGGSGLKKTVSVTKGGSFADFFMNSSGLSKNSSFGEASVLSMFNEFTKSPKSALPSVDEKSSDSSDDDIEEVSAKISITTESLKSSDDSRDGNSLKSVPTARSTGSKLPSLRMRSLREKKLSDERHDENGGLIQTKSKSDEKNMSSMSQDENGSHITTKSKSDDEKSVKFMSPDESLNQTKSKSDDEKSVNIMSQDESLHQTKSKSDEKSAQSTGSQKLQDEKNNEEQSVNSDLKSLSWVSKFKVGSNNQMAVRPQDDSINNQMISTDGKTVDRDMALDDQAIATNYFGCCGI